MFVLALDCSTSRGGVALGWCAQQEPPVAVWQKTFSAGRGRGGEMFVVLEEALRVAGEDGERPGGIVVGLGPGSYSGVRQSIAAASGLAMATGAWLRGVPSAAALEGGAGNFQAVGDARRGTFYYTAVNGAGACVAGPELLENLAALEARLAERPDWPVRAVEAPLPGGLLAEAAVCHPDAALLLHAPNDTRRAPPLEPIYLRPVSITLPNAAKPVAP